MIRRRITLLTALGALTAAGVAAGLAFAPTALAWSPANLPPGWTVDHIQNVGAASCPSAYRIRTATAGVFSDPLCEDSPTYQHDFDAYVDAHYSPPPTTPATTTGSTSTVATTTTAAATTTDTTTAQAPAAPAAPMTTDTTAAVTTATTTTSTVDTALASLQAQIDTLSAQLAQLTDRVARVERAVDAAWLAYQQALTEGVSAPAAADLARGTYLNAIYQLGAFAP